LNMASAESAQGLLLSAQEHMEGQRLAVGRDWSLDSKVVIAAEANPVFLVPPPQVPLDSVQLLQD